MNEVYGVRKEDDLYYQGPFWIVGDSVDSIMRGNFTIEGIQLPSDYEGNILDHTRSKNSLSHRNLWRNEFRFKLGEDLPYNYYPRGRVSIYKGKAFIHLHHLFNTPRIVDTLIGIYHLDGLEEEVEENDLIQGSHYDFLLG